MASSFNMPCVEKNFFFLCTGLGKGCFNVFVGSLLLINMRENQPEISQAIMGFSMIGSGLIFIFLSKVKKMEDDDLIRALSVYADENKAQMKKSGQKFANDNKDNIK